MNNNIDEEYEKLEENSTEEYWDAKEIKRDGFMSLMKFNFDEDAKGNNYIITVDANDVNRFYADTEEKALDIYESFKEDWNNSEHGDLTQNINSIVPRTEDKKIEEAIEFGKVYKEKSRNYPSRTVYFKTKEELDEFVKYNNILDYMYKEYPEGYFSISYDRKYDKNVNIKDKSKIINSEDLKKQYISQVKEVILTYNRSAVPIAIEKIVSEVNTDKRFNDNDKEEVKKTIKSLIENSEFNNTIKLEEGEDRMTKESIIKGFIEYVRDLGLEPEEADLVILGEYITDELLNDIIDDTDLDLIDDAEQEIIEKYNIQEPDYDNYDTMDILDESDDIENEEKIEDEEKIEEKPFSGVDFETKIPNRMRFKQWDIIRDDPYTLEPTRNDLYWVTQQFFGKEEVEQFANAFKETPFERALVTVRDLSTYELSTDEAKNVLVIIDKNGNIDSTGYENKIKEIGYDFDYETGKWSDEE